MKKNYIDKTYKRHKTSITAASLVVLLGISLTPFYGIAYLSFAALTAVNARYLPSGFSTLARYVLSLLLLAVYVMIMGVVAWLLHTKAAPFSIIIFSLLFHLFINNWTSTKKLPRVNNSLIDRQDLLSLVLAIIAPLIILFSFYFPNFSTSSSIQLITRGYDNIAHLTFLKATSDEGGYVYGTRAETDNRLIHGGGSYPQGWHFATSHLLNGFGAKLFQTATPLANVNAYVAVLLGWYVVTVYLFTRFSLKILSDYGGPVNRLDTYITYSVANILVQLMLFWGSLSLGFPNFIACIAYLVLLAIALHDQRLPEPTKYVLAVVTSVAVAQIWLMPLPALLLTILLYFSKDMLHSLKSWRKYSPKRWLLYLIITVTGLAMALFQAYVFLSFSAMNTSETLNNDGGIFWISNILFGIVTIFTVYYSIRYIENDGLLKPMISLMAPLLLMLFCVFIYQIFSTEKTTYYFVKLLGLSLGIIGAYFTAVFTIGIKRLDLKNIALPLPATALSLLLIGTAVISTGQTTLAFNYLFQRNSITSHETAVAVENYLNSDFKQQRQIAVLRGESFAEDLVTTYLANRLLFKTNLCVNEVTIIDVKLSERIDNLKKCANKEPRPVVVLTSSTSDSAIKMLERKDLIIEKIAD